jgi:hypothetical protein
VFHSVVENIGDFMHLHFWSFSSCLLEGIKWLHWSNLYAETMVVTMFCIAFRLHTKMLQGFGVLQIFLGSCIQPLRLGCCSKEGKRAMKNIKIVKSNLLTNISKPWGVRWTMEWESVAHTETIQLRGVIWEVEKGPKECWMSGMLMFLCTCVYA